MPGIELYNDCFFDQIKKLKPNTISIIITDPPYFLDKFDSSWNVDQIHSKKGLKVVQSLPRGMKFDQNQGKKLYQWYSKVSQKLYPILKPGGFFFTFSSPRLYHRVASAVDDAGFQVRDMLSWLYTQNQPKAMSLDHIIKKQNFPECQKKLLIQNLKGWKTPQLKSCFEPICMAQKPVDQNYLNNHIKNQVGLVNTNVKVGENMFPSNVVTEQNLGFDQYFLVSKPTKTEKGPFNDHKTVKPLKIIQYLISLTSYSPDDVVLDPFMGSGTTGIACKKLGRQFVGFEIHPKYYQISKKRIHPENLNFSSE